VGCCCLESQRKFDTKVHFEGDDFIKAKLYMVWPIVVVAQTPLRGGKVALLGLPIALGAKGCRRSLAGDTANPACDRILTLQSSPRSSSPSDWVTVPLKKKPIKEEFSGLRCVRVRLWGVCELIIISEKKGKRICTPYPTCHGGGLDTR
jgi:hypothetical protein